MAVEHPNARLIREFHAAQNRFYAGGDQEPVRAMLAADVAWHVPGRSALAGDHVGRDEVLRYFAGRRELAHATFRIAVRRVLADDEYAVILAGGHVQRDGNTLAWETVGVFRVAAGRIAACWVLPYDQHTFDYIWSSAVGAHVSADAEVTPARSREREH
jgi:ketosteroid isomerase-like protein